MFDKMFQVVCDKSTREGAPMATRIECFEANGVVQKHVERNLGVEMGSVVMEKEDVVEGECKAKLGKTVVEDGLEEGTDEAMLKFIRGVTAAKGAGFLIESKPPICTPLVHISLGHVHQEASLNTTLNGKELKNDKVDEGGNIKVKKSGQSTGKDGLKLEIIGGGQGLMNFSLDASLTNI